MPVNSIKFAYVGELDEGSDGNGGSMLSSFVTTDEAPARIKRLRFLLTILSKDSLLGWLVARVARLKVAMWCV